MVAGTFTPEVAVDNLDFRWIVDVVSGGWEICKSGHLGQSQPTEAVGC